MFYKYLDNIMNHVRYFYFYFYFWAERFLLICHSISANKRWGGAQVLVNNAGNM